MKISSSCHTHHYMVLSYLTHFSVFLMMVMVVVVVVTVVIFPYLDADGWVNERICGPQNFNSDNFTFLLFPGLLLSGPA